MPLTPQQIAAIQTAFDNDPNAQHALLLAQPNGGGLELLAEALRSAGQDNAAIRELAVFYSFDKTRNPPSRSGATLADQPVRGVLVAVDGTNVAALNANPIVIGGLCFPEVFPKRLEAVHEQWVACGAAYLFADVTAAALDRGLHLSLLPFAGGAPDNSCGGSSCPVKTQVKRR